MMDCLVPEIGRRRCARYSRKFATRGLSRKCREFCNPVGGSWFPFTSWMKLSIATKFSSAKGYSNDRSIMDNLRR